jgi:hypothetical protein
VGALARIRLKASDGANHKAAKPQIPEFAFRGFSALCLVVRASESLETECAQRTHKDFLSAWRLSRFGG